MPTVLYIGHDPKPRQKLIEQLRTSGYETLEAHSGTDGLEAIREHAPDLVLCTATLPEMTGVELISKVRNAGAPGTNTHFIMLSECGDEEARIRDIEDGADDSLPLGIDFDHVRATIFSHLRSAERIAEQRERELAKIHNALSQQDDSGQAAAHPSAGNEATDPPFAAFAGMSADILLEYKAGHGAVFASIGGVPVNVDDINRDTRGPFAAFFSEADYAHISNAVRQLQPGERLEPVLYMMSAAGGDPVPFAVRCQRDKNFPEKYFVAFAKHPDALPPDGDTPTNTLPDRESFAQIAQKKLLAAQSSGQETELTFIDLPGLGDTEEADEFADKVAQYLQDNSDGGNAAGKLDADRFGLVRADDVSADELRTRINGMIHDNGLSESGVSAETATVQLTPNGLSDEDAGRALVHAINSFAESGSNDFRISNLADSMSEYVDQTVERITDLRGTIAGNQVQLHFQPIVGLKSRKTHHFEALARFSDGRAPYETVAFAEQIGMIEDFDLEVCRQTVKHARNLLQDGRETSIAMNLSARSIQSSVFVGVLRKMMAELGNERKRVMFEITESARIRDYDLASEFVRTLRGDGHQICLDDFGAGESNFNYLRVLEVDYVKIDGAYVRDVMRSSRDQAFIRAIAALCKEIKVGTVAEFVEDERQALTLLNLGVDLGQGYLFGKPGPEMD